MQSSVSTHPLDIPKELPLSRGRCPRANECTTKSTKDTKNETTPDEWNGARSSSALYRRT
jgi:hypothetical protein